MVDLEISELLYGIDSANNIYFVSWSTKKDFYCSSSFEELTGYSKEEITQLPNLHHSLAIITEDKQISTEYEAAKKSNLNIQYKIRKKDGEEVWLKEIPLLVNKQNASLIVDISKFVSKENQLFKEVEAKRELNSSKDKLISIISHDLRAPFTSLLGFSEILLNEPNLAQEEKEEYLQYIYDASKIQLEMVNHLLDWTRLQTGAMKFDPQRLEIKDVIDNCVSVLTGAAMRKDIKFVVKAERGIFVNADEKLISQVVTNLLSNSVKFTPSGKSIFVNVGIYKDGMIEVIVKDEGKGISEKNKNKLFRIESKFSETGTAGEKGTGLGLALVKEIVEKHKGKIWFYSEEGKGSEFHFTLPISEDSILIVEEFVDLQKTYTDELSKNFPKHKIVFSKNGFEALNYLNDNIPSVLISYHSMPLMNGIQLVSSLRKKDKNYRVEVIIIGDKLSDEEISKYNDMGVFNFIKTSSSPEELTKILLGLNN